MTFQQFMNAVKSAWGAINSVTVVVAVLAACGINLLFPSIPGPATVLACFLCYLAGFLASCYEIAKLDPELAAKDAEIAELRRKISARDAELAARKDARTPTRLDLARSTLRDEGMRSFRALCAASTYVDGAPARPLVFDMNDGRLSRVGLDVASLRLMEEAGLVRIAEADERDLVGAQSRTDPADVGDGVTACAGSVSFALAGGEEVSVRPVRLTFGTDRYMADGVYGADLGVASFTSLGRELASECAALEPPFRIREYLEDAYSAGLRESRHHFRSVSDEEGASE